MKFYKKVKSLSSEKWRLLIFTFFFLTNSATCQETEKGEDANVCSLMMTMLGSARKCFSEISSSTGNSILNFDSPRDFFTLLTDSNRRARPLSDFDPVKKLNWKKVIVTTEKLQMDLPDPLTSIEVNQCMVKCVMAERGLITAEGKLNPAGFVNQQGSIPDEMRKKLSMTDFQPCIDIANKFDPNNCATYMEFSQCALGVIVKAFDPVLLDCFTKIPAVGPLFGLLQSTLANRANNNGETNNFFSRIRGQASGVRGKISDWMKVD